MEHGNPNDSSHAPTSAPLVDLSPIEGKNGQGELPLQAPPTQNPTAIKRIVLGTGILAAAAGVFAMVFGLIPPRNIPPQLSDFTPPYTCPTTLAPASCTTPIKVAVECIDLRTVDPRNRKRPPTRTELFNTDKACELLPQWLDQDPRIQIVEHEEASLILTYKLSPSGTKFTSLTVFLEKTNFGVTKGFEDIFDKASFFVEKSIIELGKRGYLP